MKCNNNQSMSNEAYFNSGGYTLDAICLTRFGNFGISHV